MDQTGTCIGLAERHGSTLACPNCSARGQGHAATETMTPPRPPAALGPRLRRRAGATGVVGGAQLKVTCEPRRKKNGRRRRSWPKRRRPGEAPSAVAKRQTVGVEGCADRLGRTEPDSVGLRAVAARICIDWGEYQRWCGGLAGD